ncbi:MAG TPA: hypothetical protein VN175_10155, partial [Rhizomicrobium sp.]|nr:hypothetical protein [Rhizomicrobium sp.]
MPTGRWRTRIWAVLLVIVIGALSVLQYFSAQELHDTLSAAQTASNAVQSDAAVELAKARQELIAKQVENDSKGRLIISLATGLSAVTAALTAIFGVLVAVSTYTEGRRKEEQDRRDALRKELESREKERQDRLDAAKRELDAREKERLDRLAAALNQTLDRLVSTDTR